MSYCTLLIVCLSDKPMTGGKGLGLSSIAILLGSINSFSKFSSSTSVVLLGFILDSSGSSSSYLISDKGALWNISMLIYLSFFSLSRLALISATNSSKFLGLGMKTPALDLLAHSINSFLQHLVKGYLSLR